LFVDCFCCFLVCLMTPRTAKVNTRGSSKPNGRGTDGRTHRKHSSTQLVSILTTLMVYTAAHSWSLSLPNLRYTKQHTAGLYPYHIFKIHLNFMLLSFMSQAPSILQWNCTMINTMHQF
jgi:hypothetical protein